MRLSLNGVSVALDSGSILSDCTIVVAPGEKVALVGPNGGGKTTLLKTIYRSVCPVAGTILLGGDNLADLRQRDVARRTAVVAQELPQESDFSVEDIVSLGRIPHQRVLDRESNTDRDVVADSLRRVGMLAHRNRVFSTLSGGEKQRVFVARALAQQTSLLLLDEPTNHLDVCAALELLELVQELEVSTLCVLHDLNLAATYFDRIYVLDNGQMVTGGTPQEVLTPALVREVFGVDTHRLIHPVTGRLLLAFSPNSAVAADGCRAAIQPASYPRADSRALAHTGHHGAAIPRGQPADNAVTGSPSEARRQGDSGRPDSGEPSAFTLAQIGALVGRPHELARPKARDGQERNAMPDNDATAAVVETEGGGKEQRWPLAADEQSLLDLIHLCFDEYWDEIWFGIMVPGAAWEVAAPNPPKRISLRNGYATVDFGRWHFHLCIGEYQGSGPEIRKIRKCSRAEMYRRLGGDGRPTSWGIRLFNGRDEQMMTLMLPNPFLTNDQQIRDEPAWGQLQLWDRLRSTYLGLDPDPLDRAGKGFGRH